MSARSLRLGLAWADGSGAYMVRRFLASEAFSTSEQRNGMWLSSWHNRHDDCWSRRQRGRRGSARCWRLGIAAGHTHLHAFRVLAVEHFVLWVLVDL